MCINVCITFCINNCSVNDITVLTQSKIDLQVEHLNDLCICLGMLPATWRSLVNGKTFT